VSSDMLMSLKEAAGFLIPAVFPPMANPRLMCNRKVILLLIFSTEFRKSLIAAGYLDPSE